MRLYEAMGEMKNGKKVRRTDWPKDWYWELKNAQIICSVDEKQQSTGWKDVGLEFIYCSDKEWELWKEPVKEVDFITAVKSFKKMTRKDWSKHPYTIIAVPHNPDKDGYCWLQYEAGGEYRPSIREILATDWIEVK